MKDPIKARVHEGILPKMIEGLSPEVELVETAQGVEMTVITKSGSKTVLIPKGQDYWLTDADKAEIEQEAFDTFKDEAEEEVLKSEGWAEGTQDGTPVEEGSPYYQHNANYWADQAEDSAEDAETAKTEAQTAAASASAAYGTSLLAANYSTESTYAVGDYVIYSGALYRCTTAIGTAEAWTAAHWAAVAIGKDVGDSKRAIEFKNISTPGMWTVGNISRSTGANSSSTSRMRTEYLSDAISNIVALNGTSTTSILELHAYDKNDSYAYKGHYDGTTIVNNTTAYNVKSINLGAIRTEYPNYAFRLVWYLSASHDAVPSEDYTNIRMDAVLGSRLNGIEAELNQVVLITNEIDEDVSKVILDNLSKPDLWKSGNISYSNGANSSSTSRMRTEYLDDNISQITALNGTATTSILVLHAYDKTNSYEYKGHYNGSEIVLNTTAYNVKTINLNAMRVTYPNYAYRLVWYMSSSYEATPSVDYTNIRIDSILSSRLDKLETDVAGLVQDNLPCQRIIRDGGFVRIFKNIGVVGDSLASGSMTIPDGESHSEDDETISDNVWWSWIQYMARTCGNTGYNFSYGGMKAKSMRKFIRSDNERAQTTFRHLTGIDIEEIDHEDANKCELYFIALGHNDYNQRKGEIDSGSSTVYPVSEENDIDFENEENNADTYRGNYAYIIQKIKKVQPKAIIVCIVMKSDATYNTDEYGKFNDVIRQMPELFNEEGELQRVFLMDMAQYCPLIDRSWEYTEGHGNTMGYLNYSWQVSSYMDWIIRHYPETFRYVQFIGTNIGP